MKAKATTLRNGFVSCAVAFVLVASIGTITPAFATGVRCGPPGPLCRVQVSFANQTIDVPVRVDPQTGIATLPTAFTRTIGGLTVNIGSVTLNPDPAILFSTSFTNLTPAPAPFTVTFTEPILLSGTINAQSSIGYTLTDGSVAGLGGSPGVTLTAFPSATVLVANDVGGTGLITNKGVDNGPTVVDPQPGGIPGTCSPFSPGTSVCSFPDKFNTFSGGPFVLMTATIGFLLSAEDSAGISGFVSQQQAVPEPTTLLLLGSGLLGLVGGWRTYSFRA